LIEAGAIFFRRAVVHIGLGRFMEDGETGISATNRIPGMMGSESLYPFAGAVAASALHKIDYTWNYPEEIGKNLGEIKANLNGRKKQP
jgi:hypothetical protein